MSEIRKFTLEATATAGGPTALLGFLRSSDPGTIVIDVSGVDQIDTLSLQILASASRQSEAAGSPLTLTGMSDEFRRGVARLGLDPDQFESEVPA